MLCLVVTAKSFRIFIRSSTKSKAFQARSTKGEFGRDGKSDVWFSGEDVENSNESLERDPQFLAKDLFFTDVSSKCHGDTMTLSWSDPFNDLKTMKSRRQR